MQKRGSHSNLLPKPEWKASKKKESLDKSRFFPLSSRGFKPSLQILGLERSLFLGCIRPARNPKPGRYCHRYLLPANGERENKDPLSTRSFFFVCFSFQNLFLSPTEKGCKKETFALFLFLSPFCGSRKSVRIYFFSFLR